jgi:hypothetical protein
MEGFSFVTPVTGLSRPNTGKEDDDDDDDMTTGQKLTQNCRPDFQGIFYEALNW